MKAGHTWRHHWRLASFPCQTWSCWRSECEHHRSCFILLAHLVDVNGSVGWSDEACSPCLPSCSSFVGQTERRRLWAPKKLKKECKARSRDRLVCFRSLWRSVGTLASGVTTWGSHPGGVPIGLSKESWNSWDEGSGNSLYWFLENVARIVEFGMKIFLNFQFLLNTIYLTERSNR